MKTLDELAIQFSTDKSSNQHGYTKIYEKYFEPLKDKEITLLEIGVGSGGSIKMWREWFTKAKVYGIDISHEFKGEEGIFIGDATSAAFLAEVLYEVEEPDIIIDDGSHVNSDVIASFKILFPQLKTGGIYVIEDVQTSYWQHYGGHISGEWGDQWLTTMNYFKECSDGLNYKEIATEQRGNGIIPNEPNYFDLNITSIHFYHNLIFIYKGDNSVTA